MRTIFISIRNNQELDIFIGKLKNGSEFWATGIVDGHRVDIDHHLTHDDLSTQLEYLPEHRFIK